MIPLAAEGASLHATTPSGAGSSARDAARPWSEKPSSAAATRTIGAGTASGEIPTSAAHQGIYRPGLLEGAVRSAIADVLANPDRVLTEARRIAETSEVSARLAEIEKAIGSVEARQGRLLKLYTQGDLPDSLLAQESRVLSAERAALEAERAQLSSQSTNRIDLAAVAADMPRVLEGIRRWVAEAEGDDSRSAADGHRREDLGLTGASRDSGHNTSL